MSNKPCLMSLLLSAAVVFAFLFGSDYAIHHIWLKDIYESTQTLWRSEAAMEHFFPLYICVVALISVVVTVIHRNFNSAACPINNGLNFGILLGVISGTHMASTYIWMPIPYDLAVQWFAAGLIQGIGAGLLLGLIAKKRCKE